jgi:hypothetical protein
MLRAKSYTLDPFIQPRPELSLRRVLIHRGRGVLIVLWRWHLLIWREAA